MSPLSLVFSSDEETSRKLGQALHELDLDVELCPEIFAAIEKITSRKFEVIVTDWDEGLEASFLLKTSRELKSNQSAFTIAVTNPASSVASRHSGADLVLTKPILVDQAKYALLTCDEFLLRMKTWLPQSGFNTPESRPGNPKTLHVMEPHVMEPCLRESQTPQAQQRTSPATSAETSFPTSFQTTPLKSAEEKYLAKSWPERPVEPSPASRSEGAAPPALRLVTPESRTLHLNPRSSIQTLFSSAPQVVPGKSGPNKSSARNRFRAFLRGTALGVAFLSVGYAFVEPARSEAVAVSVAKIYEQAVAKTHDWLHTNNDGDDDALTADAEQQNLQQAISRRNAAKIRVTEVRDLATGDASTLSAGPQALPDSQPQQIATATVGPLIPESLTSPIEGSGVHAIASKSPSLLGGLEPVDLPSEMADKLVLEKVQPSYPTTALQAGLQGPVVLQAWIGRDGTIRDLKLLNGSLLLGQAAYQAVKQWRYKPYFMNGHAVEAQTLVTVDFRLPH